MARKIIQMGGEAVARGYEDNIDVFDLIDELEKQLSEITGGTGKAYTAIDQSLVHALKKIEERRNNNEVMTGIPSGFTDIDRLTNGWQNTDLIILAARPSVGKTAFALNLARNAAINNIRVAPVLFFTLEMKTEQLTERLMSAESEIHLKKIKNGDLTDEDMKQVYKLAVNRLAKAPIFIDDTSGLTLGQLRARGRKWARKMRKQGYKDLMIIIDYLQLMSGNGKAGNREQEISEISRGLKQLAKELDLPIIALSQLSRQVESRSGEKKIPQLSDLRESGAIEQDADAVVFIYRPEYHGEMTNQEGESTKGETHIKFAKHRNGELDTIKLRANLAIQKFESWEEGWVPFTVTPQQHSSFIKAKESYTNSNEDLNDLF
jgi:replicative DNA helicase